MIDLTNVKQNTFYRGRILSHGKEREVVATFDILPSGLIAYYVYSDGATGSSQAPEFLELEEIHQPAKHYLNSRPISKGRMQELREKLEEVDLSEPPEIIGELDLSEVGKEFKSFGIYSRAGMIEAVDRIMRKPDDRDRLELTIPEQFNNLGIIKEEGFQYFVAEALQEGKHPLRIPLPYGGELGWFICDRDEKENFVILRRKKFKIEPLKIEDNENN